MKRRALCGAMVFAVSVLLVRAGHAEEASTCEGMECSGHGLCVLVGGEAACACEEGYVNEEGHRRTCVPEASETPTPQSPFETEPEQAPPPPTPTAETDPCAGVTCSGHGTCQLLRGAPVCQCDAYFMHPQHVSGEDRFQQCIRRNDYDEESVSSGEIGLPYQREQPVTEDWASQRPRGFAIELDLVMATPIYSEFLGEIVSPESFWISPQFAIGAQLGRFSVGAQTAINISNFNEEDSTDPDFSFDRSFTVLSVRLGPRIDGEVWGTQRAAVLLYAGIDLLLYRAISDERLGDETDSRASTGNGFSFDLGFGGRIYVVRQLSIGLIVGTRIDMTFWGSEVDGEPVEDDIVTRTITWSIHGGLSFRFVADRDN